MPSTAASLRELHQLHQRAKALRDRLESGPKTLAARKAAQAKRQTALDEAKKSLQDEKVAVKKFEHNLQVQQGRVDDMTVKLNTVRKNDEYKAIHNQIAADKANMGKTEGEILEAMVRVDEKTVVVHEAEVELKKVADEVAALAGQIEQNAGAQRAQLAELNKAIVEAEAVIPEEDRDRYRRTVRQRGADALAAAEHNACSGCYSTLTAQIMNRLINGDSLVFCMTCGRMLYLADDDLTSRRD